MITFGGGGEVREDGHGNAVWVLYGPLDHGVITRWNAAQTATEHRIVSTLMPSRVENPLGGDSFLRLLGRVDDTGTADTMVRREIGNNSTAVEGLVSGALTVFATNPVTTGRG